MNTRLKLQYNALLRIISRLMDADPGPKSKEGKILKMLVSVAQKWEEYYIKDL